MPALPAGTHLLHIGPQKTGSTAIQTALHSTRAALREHGVVYPGPRSKPREAAEMGLGFGRITPRGSMETWYDLLRQVHDPDARVVCVSLEAFGRATDEQVERVVAELGGERPHVLAVARAYDRLLPSQWQQRVKSQLRLTYDDWLAIVLGDPCPEDQHWANMWVPHDTVGLAERWARVVGEENVTVVARDEGARHQLHRLFEELLGLPVGFLPDDQGRENTSLSAPRAELVRHLNDLFHERGWVSSPDHERLRMAAVRSLVRAPAEAGEPRVPPVPDWAWTRLVEISEARTAGLRASAVNVVGDLDDLRVSPERPTVHGSVTEVPAHLAAAAIAEIVAAVAGGGRSPAT